MLIDKGSVGGITTPPWEWFQTITPGVNAGALNVLAMDGNFMIAGDIWDTTPSPNRGALFFYYYNGSTWTLEQTEYSTASSTYDRLGNVSAVDASTQTCVSITSYDYLTATIFVRSGTTWTVQQTITLPYQITRVAISGDTILINQPSDPTPTYGQGSVKVYTRSGTTWSLEATLESPSWTFPDFGTYIDIDGDTAMCYYPFGYGFGLRYLRTGTSWSWDFGFSYLECYGGNVDETNDVCIQVDGDVLRARWFWFPGTESIERIAKFATNENQPVWKDIDLTNQYFVTSTSIASGSTRKHLLYIYEYTSSTFDLVCRLSIPMTNATAGTHCAVGGGFAAISGRSIGGSYDQGIIHIYSPP